MREPEGQVWSGPLQVPVQEMRQGQATDAAKWAFYRDVKLRLEKTPLRFAVRYEFGEEAEARLYRNYADRWLRRECGKGYVRSRTRRSDGKWLVFFARGSNYRITPDVGG